MTSRLILGDCLEEMSQIESESVDMVLVDLPYGQTNCEWDKKINLEEMWKKLKIISKPRCQFVFFTTTKYGIELINSNPSWFRYDLVWSKSNAVGFLNAKKMPLRKHEMIYVFSNPKIKNKIYNPQKTEGKPYKRKGYNLKDGSTYGKEVNPNTENVDGLRYPTSIIECKNDRKLHPTQKPISLCEDLIRTYTNEGDLVLDFCMGSGTTPCASILTNRRYIGIELNEMYFNIAFERIDKLTKSN